MLLHLTSLRHMRTLPLHLARVSREGGKDTHRHTHTHTPVFVSLGGDTGDLLAGAAADVHLVPGLQLQDRTGQGGQESRIARYMATAQ